MSGPIRLGIIAILPSYYQDRIWRQLAAVDGLDVTVIYLSDVGVRKDFTDRTHATQRDWSDRIDLEAYRNVFLPNLGSQNLPGPLFRVNPSLATTLAREKFDVVLLPGHGTVSTLGAALYCLATNTPVIYRGEAVPRSGASSALSKAKSWVDRALLRELGVVMYSCTGNRNFFESRGVRPEQLMHIPCAVDNDFYQEQYAQWHPRRDEVREEIGSSEDDVVVAYVGQLLPRKRVAEIPEIARRVTESKPKRNVRWLVIGDGPERKTLERRREELGVDNIYMAGYQDQPVLGKWLSAADIGVVLSDYDPSPKALNEMMNFRLALICTEPVGTAFDLVREGRNGHVVPLGDVAAVARRIVDMIDHDTLDAYGRESLSIVQRWSFDADVEAIRNAIHRLARSER